MSVVRLALTASLLSATAFTYAGPAQSVDDSSWTRVDLDNVPKVVQPSKAKGKHRPQRGKTASAKDIIANADDNVPPTPVAVEKSSSVVVGPQQPTAGMGPDSRAPAPVGPFVKAIDPAAVPVKSVPVMVEQARPEPPKSEPVKAMPAKLETAKPGPAAALPVTASSVVAAPVVVALVKPEPLKVEPGKAELPRPQPVASAPAPAPAPKPVPTFALNAKDRVIRTGVERWVAAAGWKLSWELADGAAGGVVKFDADFGTDFDVALSKLAAAMRSETKVHAYLYAENKVLRILEEESRPVVSSAVPMTLTLKDGMQRDAADRGLPHVTRVKGYWLGASGTDAEDAPPEKLPAIFDASVSLVFSEKANMATVTGILTKVTGVPILLPGAIEFSVSGLFANDKVVAPATKKSPPTGKRTYVGTARKLLDRISVSTGLLWEFKDETIVFTE